MMEEEYRQQRSENEQHGSTQGQGKRQSVSDIGNGQTKNNENGPLKDSATKGSSPDKSQLPVGINPPSPIPTITVSASEDPTVSTTESRASKPSKPDDEPDLPPPIDPEEPVKSPMEGPVDGVDKPLATHPLTGPTEQTTETATVTKKASVRNSFMNKRLCERWLDNLFMVLYEDLRVYTIWRAEVAHFKAQHMPYRKTGTEWEILGDLAFRLHHKEEAKDAFQRCLEAKFSAKAWLKLLEFYTDEGDVQRSLNAAIRLSTYQHRWYMEMSFPTAVAHQLYKLIRQEGVAKISYSLVSMNLPQPILKTCMQGYFHYAQVFRIEGSEI